MDVLPALQLLQPDPSQLLLPQTPGPDGGASLQPPGQHYSHIVAYILIPLRSQPFLLPFCVLLPCYIPFSILSKVNRFLWINKVELEFPDPQVSALTRDNEKDSYRLSWGTENLDNVALCSSPIPSG